VQLGLVWAMLLATVGSAVQYGIRAVKLLGAGGEPPSIK